MDAITRAHVAEHRQLEEEAFDAADEAQQDEISRYLSKHHKFELLDTVFKEFIGTNTHRGRHYSFEELLRVSDRRYFGFTHLSIPYLAAVFVVRGKDADWLNIKLCNDGFVYRIKEGREISRHMSTGWVRLSRSQYLPYLQSILSVVGTAYDSVRAFYNYQLMRFDLKFVPKQGSSSPHLLITFEPGYPDMDDSLPVDRF